MTDRARDQAVGDQRLGDWRPTTTQERLDRMESYAAVQQLASRYARSLDARDMAAVVALFDPDVQVGVDGRGRPCRRG